MACSIFKLRKLIRRPLFRTTSFSKPAWPARFSSSGN